MVDNVIGLVAVMLTCGIPVAGMYTFYRIRKLRTEERIAAIARGAQIPMEQELSPAAKSRRYGIILVSVGLGFFLTFAAIASFVHEPATMAAASS